MSISSNLDIARSALFVPGDRPDRFLKATQAAADLVILDLEDSVPPDHKTNARREMTKWLRTRAAVVRINAVGTDFHDDDIRAVQQARPLAVMLPKAEPEGVDATHSLLGDLPLIPLIETPRGVWLAHETCRISAVRRVALGTLDLAADLGCSPEDSPVATAADLVALASAASRLPGPWDGVCSQLYDVEAVAIQARSARRKGYGGKLAVHPAQIPPINVCFTPSESEVAWAQEVLRSTKDGAVALNGQLVDEPVLRRARHLMTRVRG